MDPTDRKLLLLKIVIGSAWADGQLDESELSHLQTLIHHHQFTDNFELEALLKTPVPLADTERWIIDYLANSTEADRAQLSGNLTNLIIADNEISPAESELLDDYHRMMIRIPAHETPTPDVMNAIGGFFRQAVKILKPRRQA